MNLANTNPVTLEADPPPQPGPAPGAAPETETTTPGEGWRVILFNDDTHSMDEVALQLMLALDCPAEVAHHIMMTAHRTGRATAAITTRPEADRIAGVLRQIALRVRVEPV